MGATATTSLVPENIQFISIKRKGNYCQPYQDNASLLHKLISFVAKGYLHFLYLCKDYFLLRFAFKMIYNNRAVSVSTHRGVNYFFFFQSLCLRAQTNKKRKNGGCNLGVETQQGTVGRGVSLSPPLTPPVALWTMKLSFVLHVSHQMGLRGGRGLPGLTG